MKSRFVQGFGSLGIVAAMLAVGPGIAACSWFSANKGTVESDGGQIASCVIAQVASGDLNPIGIVAACAGSTVADVVAIVESLISFYTSPAVDGGVPPAVDPAKLAELRSISAAGRAAMARGEH
jgi:hypothetical protein